MVDITFSEHPRCTMLSVQMARSKNPLEVYTSGRAGCQSVPFGRMYLSGIELYH